jgi:dihydrofolate reductase
MSIQCSVFIATSLDGFIARKDGGIDWLTNAAGSDSKEDYGYHAFMDSIDALVMGRNTYELVLSFGAWPYAGKPVVVLSTGSPPVPAHLHDKVRVSSLAPAALLAELERGGTRRVYVDGGKTIQGFLRAGLINDLTITRIPILLGEGRPLFGELTQDISLEHIETRSWPNGFVQSHYRVK